MWIYLAIGSAIALGLYDVAKKQSLKKNDVLWILLVTSAISTLFLIPFLKGGSTEDHLTLMGKSVLVSASWISGLIGIKYLPITTASTIKASRPMFVVLFSMLFFSERMNFLQWAGVICVMSSLFLLSRSSKKEGIGFRHNKGIAAMGIAIISGVASALLDKHIMGFMEPLFVQSWCNFYITICMLICLLVKTFLTKGESRKFHWDWTLPVISILITAADAMYFFALGSTDSLLGVISVTRRCSVIITFVCGAILFKEKNITAKALDLAVMLCGIVLLVLGSN